MDIASVLIFFLATAKCVRRRPFWVERNDNQKYGCVRKLGEA